MLTFYEMVGQRIIERLNELGWSQQNLADKLKISKQVMSKILNGEKNTTILEIRKIADELSVSIERLLSPIDKKITLITDKSDVNNGIPQFMGRVSTTQGQHGVNRALNVINMILRYKELNNETMVLRNRRVDFSEFKKVKTFKPDL